MIANLIVPVLNRYDLLRRMLASLDFPIRDLLIIDNGGRFEDVFERDELPVKNLHVLMMPSNLGVPGSWNLGIKLFPHDPVWTFASNDMWFRPGDLERLSTAHSGSLTLSQYQPHFHTFAVGEAVINRVGLFDERFYPAYCEDNDFQRRVQFAGFPIARLDVAPGHDNSSTLAADSRLQERNQDTFRRNVALFRRKVADNDMSFSWSLDSRRLGEWLR